MIQRVLLEMLSWALLLPVGTYAQFEGILESKNLTTDETGGRQEYLMTMLIKPDMVRIQTTGSGTMPGSTIIYRSDKQTVWFINDNDKTYFEIPQGQDTGQPPTQSGQANRGEIKKSGKARTILGYPCDQLMITGLAGRTEIWGTKKLGNLFNAISKALGDGKADNWTDEIVEMGYFPLISITKIDGRVVESQEVTKLQHKKLSREIFDLPEGYEKHGIEEMFEGLRDSTGK